MQSSQTFKELRSITIENTKVDVNSLYLFKMNNRETNLPVFLKILRIYYFNDRHLPMIIGKLYLARSFVEKYYAYGVQETNEIGAINGTSKLLHHKPLCMYTYRNQTFVLRDFHVSSINNQ